MIMPILTNIGNLVSCYSTKSFLNYVDEFKQIDNLVRKGKVLLSKNVEDEQREPTTNTMDTTDDIQFHINENELPTDCHQ